MLESNKIETIIGNRIRNYRKRLGYSQETLAEKANLHHTYIGQIERGERSASLHSILKVANVLEIPLEILFENIILNESQVDTIPSQCYELIDKLTLKEQEAILKLIKDIITYREL
ncbi:helix-turn-helix domain-containing protein [Clostridioides sp. ES-S-0048-02]|uniref:helix-turn-helix domain-containing protein n=1 Tax=Clostridioides sp. ES-S-0048-02 TaxID=2770777 RepID=UPI001D10D805|nr:helix-turn-helix transcriptional regulator [Clostridioides sp. ES-S-0048-02]